MLIQPRPKVVVTRMVTQVLFKREQKEDRRKENASPTRSIMIKLNAQEGYGVVAHLGTS
jgi:hypothetical protein